MSDYIGVVTTAGLAKIAASVGGTALELAVIRLGDGGGGPITPWPGMTDLVRRVGTAYAISESEPDPENPGHWRVQAVIPAEAGPFDIREIGVFDASGALIAVARHPLVEKRTVGLGAAMEVVIDAVFPVSAAAQITVQFSPGSVATQGWVEGNYLPRAEAEEDYLTKAEAQTLYERKPAPWHFFSLI